MPPHHSTEFLDIPTPTTPKHLHRSRSGGYTDYLADKEKWERRDREQEMKRYHDARHTPSYQQRSPSDRLYVPAYDANHRRTRSYDQIVEKKGGVDEDEDVAEVRGYKVREERPGSYDGAAAGVSPARTSEMPVRRPRAGTGTGSRKRRPSIKVQIHQDDMPRPTPERHATPRRSPRASASPRSAAAQPQLIFLVATLQNRLAEIREICQPSLHVEAADPGDLTFEIIKEEVEASAFQLGVWGRVVNVDGMERIDRTKRDVVEAAARTLDRIVERVEELREACQRATPRDLKIGAMLEADDGEEEYESYEDSDDDGRDGDDGTANDPTASLGFIIQCHLDSIRLQMQTLFRMTRPLQEAVPDAEDEVVAVGGLIAEVDGFFGSPEALARYRIDRRLAGREALDEARYVAGRGRGMMRTRS